MMRVVGREVEATDLLHTRPSVLFLRSCVYPVLLTTICCAMTSLVANSAWGSLGGASSGWEGGTRSDGRSFNAVMMLLVRTGLRAGCIWHLFHTMQLAATQ